MQKWRRNKWPITSLPPAQYEFVQIWICPNQLKHDRTSFNVLKITKKSLYQFVEEWYAINKMQSSCRTMIKSEINSIWNTFNKHTNSHMRWFINTHIHTTTRSHWLYSLIISQRKVDTQAFIELRDRTSQQQNGKRNLQLIHNFLSFELWFFKTILSPWEIRRTERSLTWLHCFTYRWFGHISSEQNVFAGLLVGYTHTLFWCHCLSGYLFCVCDFTKSFGNFQCKN